MAKHTQTHKNSAIQSNCTHWGPSSLNAASALTNNLWLDSEQPVVLCESTWTANEVFQIIKCNYRQRLLWQTTAFDVRCRNDSLLSFVAIENLNSVVKGRGHEEGVCSDDVSRLKKSFHSFSMTPSRSMCDEWADRAAIRHATECCSRL